VAKDQKGNLVRDLRREDFEIFEDGNPQSVIHFSVGAAVGPPSLERRPGGRKK
jgi:hypothetical protein